MFGYRDTRFRDILILCAGALGFLSFYWGIGNFWLPAGGDLSAGEDYYVQQSDSLIRSFGYQIPDLPARHNITALGFPADSLIQRFGIESVRNDLVNSDQPRVPRLTNRIRRHQRDLRMQTMMQIDLSEDGTLVQFQVDPEIVQSQTPFNTRLMGSALREGLGEELTRETLDTLLSGLVEYQHNREASSNYQNMRAVFNRLATREGRSVLGSYLSEESIWRAAEYYLSNSFWSGLTLRRDSLIYDEENNYKVARTFLSAEKEIMGVGPNFQVDILPAGSLLRMEVSYLQVDDQQSRLERVMEQTLVFLTFLFGIWILVIFYLRIKARALDTGPALVVSFLAGFMSSAYFLFAQFGGVDVSLLVSEQGVSNILFVLGLVGAVAAVVFFLLTSVSDSITRQYWPVKLRTWDLIRQGMFNNKPVGWAIVRGIMLGGILAGVYVLCIFVLPDTYLQSNFTLISRNIMLAPIAQVLLTLLISMVITVPLFMVLVNQIRSLTKKNWIIPVIAALFFVMITSWVTEIVPFRHSLIIGAITGSLLGLFYIRFDFLTLILAQFTFLNTVASKESWLIQGSPDQSVFIVISLITSGLLVAGFLFVVRGNEADEVPRYVPEYLEDQAQRERVKQELQIARTVQITFLPEYTPEVEGFDISAVCIPAMDTGGDYYDIIKLDEEQTAIAIGDVSGKGIKAAFYMTFTKGVIHSLCSMLRSPKELMSKANRLFHENAPRGTFISMIYGVLDQKKSTFTHVRAGHNPILIKRAGGSLEWLKPNGVAVGMARKEGFDVATEELVVHLEPGDVMVLYTDGITEAQNEEDAFYEERRLKNLLKRQEGVSALELRNLIIEDVRTFMGRATQYDDMTLVVIMCTKNG